MPAQTITASKLSSRYTIFCSGTRHLREFPGRRCCRVSQAIVRELRSFENRPWLRTARISITWIYSRSGRKDNRSGHRSFARLRQSNDNPFSESMFKTLKYAPVFPERFHSHDHAHSILTPFFDHNNDQHRHTGIGLMTPSAVDRSDAPRISAARAMTLQVAFVLHPRRFKGNLPTAPTRSSSTRQSTSMTTTRKLAKYPPTAVTRH
jgi:hypothetical protein